MINTLPELILSKVCEYYKVDKAKVISISKKGNLPKARHVYSYLASSMTTLTREKVGEIINRDHSSVTFAIAKIGGLCKIYADMNIEVMEIKNLIQAIDISIEVKDVNLLYQAQVNTKFLNSWAI